MPRRVEAFVPFNCRAARRLRGPNADAPSCFVSFFMAEMCICRTEKNIGLKNSMFHNRQGSLHSGLGHNQKQLMQPLTGSFRDVSHLVGTGDPLEVYLISH